MLCDVKRKTTKMTLFRNVSAVFLRWADRRGCFAQVTHIVPASNSQGEEAQSRTR
jgi:hypothetical protein